MRDLTSLGAKTFGINDQALFADWSGDRNPLHVSEIAARRLVSGKAVVHGIHLVLEALSRWAPVACGPALSIKAEFSRPANVGDSVHFSAIRSDDLVQLVAEVDERPCMTLEVREKPIAAAVEIPQALESMPRGSVPLDAPIDAWVGRVAALPEMQGRVECADRVASWLGRPAADGLGQLSTMVGMLCPGLHSIFSSFEVDLKAPDGAQRFRLMREDPRFRLVELEVDGALRGRVRAFQRPAPQPQASMQEIADLVPDGAFVGIHCWVLGGSRGLGEVAAKMIAAGGGNVTLTYFVGRDDAQRVVDEIGAAGRGSAKCVEYRVGETSPVELCARLDRPDAVFYFATPRIARQRASTFDASAFAEFVRYYVEELHSLAAALQNASVRWNMDRPVRVFNPSSVFVEELPNGMVEYSMAKSASEVLGRDLSKRMSQVRVSSFRLPRMQTDQTLGILPGAAADPVVGLLVPLREHLQGL
jgi:NAD(P)-dependent dehydrogenase (short-subunit alcohol dehydrogenase family)